MPRFGKASLDKLVTCDPELQTLFLEVVKTFDCSVICGYRDKIDQEKAFKDGASKKHWPESKHNIKPSRAVDVAPFPISWNNRNQFMFFAGYVKGIADKLYASGIMTKHIRLGADFNQNLNPSDESFVDLPHFEVI